MQAGKLNELIEIYKPELSVNEYGEQVQEYVRCYSTRAEVIYNSGNRAIENQEITHQYQKTFKVRYYVKLNETYQIKFQNKMYRILSIDAISKWNEKIITTEMIND